MIWHYRPGRDWRPPPVFYPPGIILALVIISLCLLFIFLTDAQPHQASTGMVYPNSCCANTHCHPVPCDELTEDDNGDWRWERFIFDKRVVQPSQDKHCHVCTNNSQGLCAFIQQGA